MNRVGMPFGWIRDDLSTADLFALFWASATLCHQTTFNLWIWFPLDVPIATLLTLSALFTLFYVRSTVALATMVALSAAYVFLQLPRVPNHIFFEWFLNLALLAGLVPALTGRRKRPEGADFRLDWIARFAPVARYSLFALYFWVVVHKLNTDYLNPDHSCAVYLLDGVVLRINHNLDLLFAPELISYDYPGFVRHGAIWGTLFFEAAIPILLAFRRTRLAGVAVGVLFHAGLAAHPHDGIYSFSAMLFALFFLAAADQLTPAFNDLRRFAADRLGFLFRRPWLLAALLLGAGVAAVALDWIRPVSRPVFRSGLYFSIALGALLLAMAVRAWRSGTGPATPAPARRAGALMVVPALVLLNGLSPYLGLKTESCFSMFSNLRTEEGDSNHLFIPSAFQVFDFQDDVITVSSSNFRIFGNDRYHDAEVRHYTAFEFRRRMRTMLLDGTEFSADCLYRGERFSLEIANGNCSHPEWVEPRPYWMRKLLIFRPVFKGPSLCQH